MTEKTSLLPKHSYVVRIYRDYEIVHEHVSNTYSQAKNWIDNYGVGFKKEYGADEYDIIEYRLLGGDSL